MGYRIKYPVTNQLEAKYVIRKRPPMRVTAVILCVIFLTISLYTTGIEGFAEFLIPGDNAVTVLAFEEMQKNLKEGMAMKDALSTFCKMIIQSQD